MKKTLCRLAAIACLGGAATAAWAGFDYPCLGWYIPNPCGEPFTTDLYYCTSTLFCPASCGVIVETNANGCVTKITPVCVYDGCTPPTD